MRICLLEKVRENRYNAINAYSFFLQKRENIMKKLRIILASGSSARSHILSQCGIPHTVMASNVKEIMDVSKGPRYNARINARRKAQAIAEKVKDGIVIGADSLVLLGRRLIGKPKSKQDAQKLLTAFSGKTISLYTGLCLKDVRRNKSKEAVTVTTIKVKRIAKDEFNKYLEKLEPYDKAGGFSIEGVGSFIFDDIKGSYFNVLGLPTITLKELFKKLGIDLLDYIY